MCVSANKLSYFYRSRSGLNLLSSSILKSFESEFGDFQQDCQNLASVICEEVSWRQTKRSKMRLKRCPNFEQLQRISQTLQYKTLKRPKYGRVKKQSCDLSMLAQFIIKKNLGSKHASEEIPTVYTVTRSICSGKKNHILHLYCTVNLDSGKTGLSVNVVKDLKISTSAVAAFFWQT